MLTNNGNHVSTNIILLYVILVDGFIDKALVQEAEYKVKDLEQLVSNL